MLKPRLTEKELIQKFVCCPTKERPLTFRLCPFTSSREPAQLGLSKKTCELS